MPLYHPKHREEAKAVKSEVMATIVHAFLERVQAYSEETIDKKWAELNKGGEINAEAVQKHSDWVRYHQFNEIALKEIEDGTLDSWFATLMK
ncbi:MAG: hypothetical protein ABGX83_08675 [Nitrospira sp.]|nr:hypothetical protein [Candidatus Manganitrophaceae bacterium]HIL33843.1 hypothetical protein [Candidatus Manganitrophaceae bacterium]